MLTVAIIGLLSVLVLMSQRSAIAARRDVKRFSDIKSLEQGLSLYLAKVASYPAYDGCITGTDPVTLGLRAQGIIAPTVKISDPAWPADPALCYYYKDTVSTYTIRYNIEETTNAGTKGVHTLTP